MSVKDKLRGVTFSKTWTTDQVADWFKRLRLKRKLRKLIKEKKKNVGSL